MALKVDRYTVRLEWTRAMLGTVPKNQDVYEQYILTKAAKGEVPDERAKAELESIETVEERGWTGFRTDPETGRPALVDFMILGFFKEACGNLRRISGSQSARKALRAYKRVLGGLVFVYPMFIPLTVPIDFDRNADGYMERPLRAETAQGPRVTLARSDIVPAGTTCTFVVEVLGVVTEDDLREWLLYGARHGMGQWRSGFWGRFQHTLKKMEPDDDEQATA